MMIAEAVADTSAILAAFRGEPGGDQVRELAQVSVSTVNLAEIVHVMGVWGLDVTALESAPLSIHPFDQADALEAGRLLRLTRPHGLSFADCACLALAKRLELPVLTADRAWAALDLGVEVVLIR